MSIDGRKIVARDCADATEILTSDYLPVGEERQPKELFTSFGPREHKIRDKIRGVRFCKISISKNISRLEHKLLAQRENDCLRLHGLQFLKNWTVNY